MADDKPKWYKNKLDYIRDYNRKNKKQIKFELNINTDADIIKHLEKKENKQGYIKQLIRDDMAKK